ncbi:MAG: hypothetical protein JNM10_07840 [Planctomycetia bacterium]|nr:hypothetical protein [Planctomycetia bacterium]
MPRPLGLPVGSIRALTLLALAARAVLDLRADGGIASWLGAALLVCAAAYFASRASRDHVVVSGSAADGTKPRPPLGLPTGTVRFLFLVAISYGAWLWFKDHRLTESQQPLVIVVGAFAIGVLVRWFLAQVRPPTDASTLLFEHVQSFVVLIAAAGLVTLRITGKVDEVDPWIQPTLAAACTYYAGVR